MTAGLQGRRVVVPESRELDLFVTMLERHGTETVRCPMVGIHDVEDAVPVEAWLGRLVAGGFDDLVLYTGEGVTRLLGFARRAGIEAEVVAAMRTPRKIVRGPKPTRALRLAGLAPDLSAAMPTTEGLVAVLSGLDLRGRRVGVQTYPEMPPALLDHLAQAGAAADPVLCYRYASDEEDGRVAAIIRSMAAGEVDLIAFTSTPQVRRLRDVARKHGLEAELDAAAKRTRIAAVGPVTAEAVEAAGWHATIMPPANFHLKPFVAEIAATFRAPAGRVAASLG